MGGLNKSLLSVQGLTLKDSTTNRAIFEGLDLDVSRNEIVCLEGPSGSGKSLTARAITGLLPANIVVDNGQIIWKESEIGPPRKTLVEEGILFLFQDTYGCFNPLYPVGIQIADPFDLKSGPPATKNVRQKVIDALSYMEVDDPERVYNSRPTELSGGQLQRCNFASAMLLEL